MAGAAGRGGAGAEGAGATDAAALEAALARRMALALKTPGRTKRSAARLAIARAISEGLLRPGDRLPPEKRLAPVLGVSLGTVQAALRQLQQTATIVRRRGDGTRVASREPLGRDIWHFRFAARDDGTPLRMVDERVWIERATERGDWSGFLACDPPCLRIRRRLTMQNGLAVGAEMLLDPARVPGLEAVESSELSMMNIRPYLEERFGLVAARVAHSVRLRRLDRAAAASFDLPAGREMFEIRAEVPAADGRPLYFQRILVEAARCVLSFDGGAP